MNKIIVIGCPGSGKTTFAKRLAERTGMPLYHLDAVWHKPDKTHIPREEFDLRLGEILLHDSWIIDGNYQRTMERRIEACDTVILFDLPTETALEGAMSRIGKMREDMPWAESELDPIFKKQIEDFGINNLPVIYSLIEKHGDGREIVIFKSREAADGFLRSLTESEMYT